jgi:hypothetical protein
MTESPAHGLQDAHAFDRHLRAYSVATQYGDIELHLVPPGYLKPDTVIEQMPRPNQP